MSFSAWLNPSDASAYRTLFSNRNANTGNYNGIDFGITSSGNIYSRFSDGSNQGSTSSNTVPIPLNTWTHLAFTVDTSAGEAKVYKNGSLSYTVSIGTGSGIATGNDFYIGRYFTSSSSYIKGKVGQVRIFNDALTSSEVTELYNETASDNSVLNYPAGAGCIAAYPLQTDAVDLSGNYSGASSNVTFGQPGYLTGNTDGTIPSTVAANQEAGFSIVEYTGNATSGATIAHGLGVDADMVIVKSTNLSQAWNVYVKDITDTSAKYLRLNQNDAILTTASPRFIPNNFTSDVFSVGNDNSTNGNNDNYIAYCFTSIPGYSKIGSYIGNDTTNTIYVGFKPRFLLIKCSSNGGTNKEWVMIDSTMDPSTPITKRLEANTSDAEATDTINITMNNNGWTMPNGTSTASINQIGFSYIFLAIA